MAAMRLVLVAALCRVSRQDTAVLEHEVTLQQAQQRIRSVRPQEGKVPGCGECTYWERFYCISHEVLDDHCCCDRQYAEWFPYVPHQCYLEDELCTTHAADCEEYMRIKTCCCDFHTPVRCSLARCQSKLNTPPPPCKTSCFRRRPLLSKVAVKVTGGMFCLVRHSLPSRKYLLSGQERSSGSSWLLLLALQLLAALLAPS